MSTNIVLKKGHTTLDLGSINQFRLSPDRIFCENGELDSYYTNLIFSFKEDLYNLLIYRPPKEDEFRETLNQLVDDFADSVDGIGRSYILNNLMSQVDKVERV